MIRPDELRTLALPALGTLAAGYLLGSLPFGHWVARAHGVDIFEQGSKSPGATNVRRVLGSRAGNTVFVLDAVKGMVAAGWPMAWTLWRLRQDWADDSGRMASAIYWSLVLGAIGLVGALIGHSFSCFTRFRGGKGVATGAGGFLVLMPIVTLIGAGVWVLLFFTTGYVSLASIAAAITLPVAGCLLHQPGFLTAIAAAVAVFVVFRHRANIGRLLTGKEHRRGRKPPAVS